MPKLNMRQVIIKAFFVLACLFLFRQGACAEEAKTNSMEQALGAAENKAVPENPSTLQEVVTPVFRKELQTRVTPAKEEDEFAFSTEHYFLYAPKQKVHAQDGKVGIMDTASEYNYEYKLFGKLPLQFTFQHNYVSIDNSTVVKMPAHLTGLSFGIEATMPLLNFKNMYFRMAVNPSYYTDNWSAYQNAFRLPQRYFAIWQPNEKLTAILGVAVFPRFETSLAPIAGVIYQPNDKWLFNLVPTRPTINYMLNDKVTLFGEYALAGGEYVVTKDGIKGTVLQYDEQHAGGGIQYEFNKNINASVVVGGMFGRTLQYRESYGKVDINSGVYTEFRLNGEF